MRAPRQVWKLIRGLAGLGWTLFLAFTIDLLRLAIELAWKRVSSHAARKEGET